MTDTLALLFDAARTVAAKAHAPYSKFQVGAAINAGSGALYSGCNVENAAYPVGTCAEAGAIAAMIAGGDTLIKDIAIVSLVTNPCMPCGACRQRIAEMSNAATRIHVTNPDGTHASYSIDDLLPHGFGPKALR